MSYRSEPNKRFDSGFMVAAALVVGDQLIKHLIERLAFPVSVAGISIGKIINPVGIFSLDIPNGVLIVLNLAISVVLVGLLITRSLRPPARLGLWLVLGGTLCNVIDRVQYGGVIDIVAIWGSARFNLADVMIVLGAISLVRSLWWQQRSA